MAIVPLDKLTLYGSAGQRKEVLSGLQQLGCVHVVSLREALPSTAEHPIRSEVHEALEYLQSCPVQRQRSHTRKGFDCRTVARDVLAIKHRRQELSDERDYLLRSTKMLEPWGDFRLPSDKDIATLRFWFYVLRHHQLADLGKTDLTWQIVGEDNQSVYVVVISPDQPQSMPASPVELDRRPLSEVTARLEAVDDELDNLHWMRVALTRWSTLLAQDLDVADDEVARTDALHRTLADDNVFAVQGWVPRKATSEIREFAERHALALTIQTPTRSEKPPTLLRNPEAVAGAEGAVTFYITPDYHTWDPTWIVYFSFALFFAMIVSDAGYGLLLGGLLVFYLGRKLGHSRAKIRLRNLLAAIVVATVVYGILIGSYFGLSPAQGSVPHALQIHIGGYPLMASQNQGTMMVVAIAIGVFHLALANLISAWNNRDSPRCLSAIAWATGLLSGFALGIATMMQPNPLAEGLSSLGAMPYLQAQDAVVRGSTVCLIGSAIAIFAFSSSRPLFSRRIGDWGWRILDGAQALTGVSKAFGDVLSYLRLFALGLASAQLAVTFNDLARGATEIRGAGILLAILIVVAGHGINLLLCIVSGVVHGLRLNCIEFFSWSLKDEGHPFRAFSKKAIH